MNALEVLPNRKYFRPASAERDIGLVKCSHHVKRKAQQLQPNENHQQLFTAHEQHETDRCQKNNRQIFASDDAEIFLIAQGNCEKGKRQADDFEKRRERRDHKHSAEKVAFRGNISTAPLQCEGRGRRPMSTSPSVVGAEMCHRHFDGGFAGDTAATTVARPLISPIVSTTRA